MAFNIHSMPEHFVLHPPLIQICTCKETTCKNPIHDEVDPPKVTSPFIRALHTEDPFKINRPSIRALERR
jgi:hypothetical protein